MRPSRTNLPKVVVIVGPTATGKSAAAVELAQDNNGEIISADSRQVYRHLDIGTGKITAEEMGGIPHHLLDVAEPSQPFTVADYKILARKAMNEILEQRKLPLICGGTGLYVSALIDDLSFPEVLPNTELREELASLSVSDLYEKLSLLDPQRAASIDPKNPRRLIRALEIVAAQGSVPRIENGAPLYDSLWIGLDHPDDALKKRIADRLHARIDQGMVEEAQELHRGGMSYERMEELGLEYRYLARFLKHEISREELTESIRSDTWQYAKRQRTWWKRDARITWFHPEEKETIAEHVATFLGGRYTPA